ncbi:MAG: ATP-dependent carboxylate-amine ligase, partial [Natronospirillum sp.]
NTRFWGSLQLAIDSGVDFPTLLVEAQLGLPTAPQAHYRVGQRLRWWLGDLDSLYIYLKQPYPWPQKLKRVGDFFAIHLRGQRHEINRWSDLKPSWFEVKEYIRALRGRT